MRPVLVLLLMLTLASCSDQQSSSAGAEIARRAGCVSCHTSDGSEGAGPTWKGLFGKTVTLDDGSTVVADDRYLKESILNPSAKTVAGFKEGLMETAIKPDSLTEDEVKELLDYIKSLS